MSKRLVLLRHGRTAWNHGRRLQGQTDVPLDEVGLAQADAAAPGAAALEPVRLWTSDLQRAQRTAAPVAALTGLEPRVDARLRELSFGEYEGLTHPEVAERDPGALSALRRGAYEEIRPAERPDVAVARMLEVLGEVVDDVPPVGTAVVVSHGAVIRLATAALLGWPAGLHHTLRHLDNCAWSMLTEHPETGELQLVQWNRAPEPAVVPA